ncbi:F-box associated domain-containing protein [Caenorhabditis elegans]|uniref:F-box associated domain-containing protein n=1 Tax=Caenorhabditis elegans TaxID=6239 RepID=O45535_CAEEL|nr:F-box associated domain-containing protein [Caenorhabditis elegans]CAB04423.3 F-box associated domain-containing protein [Caenorhabditis elegans]|eukprot:NP_493499.2 F-box B protein [Caenorhabditis elegans]
MALPILRLPRKCLRLAALHMKFIDLIRFSFTCETAKNLAETFNFPVTGIRMAIRANFRLDVIYEGEMYTFATEKWLEEQDLEQVYISRRQIVIFPEEFGIRNYIDHLQIVLKYPKITELFIASFDHDSEQFCKEFEGLKFRTLSFGSNDPLSSMRTAISLSPQSDIIQLEGEDMSSAKSLLLQNTDEVYITSSPFTFTLNDLLLCNSRRVVVRARWDLKDLNTFLKHWAAGVRRLEKLVVGHQNLPRTLNQRMASLFQGISHEVLPKDRVTRHLDGGEEVMFKGGTIIRRNDGIEAIVIFSFTFQMFVLNDL